MAREAACCTAVSSMALTARVLLVLAATLTVAVAILPATARAAWVDYPSGVPCGVTIPVEQCDPGDAAANSACMDVCHYGGCRRGGQCVSLGLARGRGCHCKC
ncbi:hypothetical protein Zm00014a_008912 [Zea mays]|uniref:Uncharacterized protein n=3 Tax=Zea mays TaxID=4577 RepID=A0A8J8YLW9_MAIZE|nr:uncharacterized protein LOC103643366 [Zea mays]ONM05095.1 hypothetical protein ZEAMMB73_Zm00001d032447 [Zea mays]PWZ54460.1 hypothetical protein Zm00014a_008912 [Zea mays]|eukprot:XP_023157101.1 uncharacterized protein LOC103643366 [Zea mays]